MTNTKGCTLRRKHSIQPAFAPANISFPNRVNSSSSQYQINTRSVWFESGMVWKQTIPKQDISDVKRSLSDIWHLHRGYPVNGKDSLSNTRTTSLQPKILGRKRLHLSWTWWEAQTIVVEIREDHPIRPISWLHKTCPEGQLARHGTCTTTEEVQLDLSIEFVINC